MKIVVLDGYCLNHGDLDWSGFFPMGEVEVFDRTSPEELLTKMAGAEVMITNKATVNKQILDALPDLKYIGVLATGYNNIDCAYARQKGVTVTNIPSYGTESVVQSVFGLLIELYHGQYRHFLEVKAGEWGRTPDYCFYSGSLRELAGKTIGIIGCGRIGRRVAAVAKAFGMKTIGYDSAGADFVRDKASAEIDEAKEDIDDVFREADVLTLHCFLTEENKGLVDKRRISLMKKDAVIINTARGPLIDERALADALNEGRLAGAGLDVLSEEPPINGNPLIGAKNAIITPHIAWATYDARSRLMDTAVDNLKQFLAGRPVNTVN